jgi:hypothetical protein
MVTSALLRAGPSASGWIVGREVAGSGGLRYVCCQRGNITNRDQPQSSTWCVCVDGTRLLRTLAANLLPTRSLVHSFSSLLTTRPTSPTSSHATLIGTQSHSLAFILLCHRYPLRALPPGCPLTQTSNGYNFSLVGIVNTCHGSHQPINHVSAPPLTQRLVHP